MKEVGDSFDKRMSEAKFIIKTHLSEVIEFRNSLSDLSSEEYILDNSHGSELMVVEQEISKTINNNLTLEDGKLTELGLTAGIRDVIQGQIKRDLSRKLGISIGESLSKRHTFRFSVLPGNAVVYTILWKHRLQNGKYNLLINGEDFVLPYQVQYDLLYEVHSKPTIVHPKEKKSNRRSKDF